MDKRVLLLAEAANPEWTSVPLIGWSLAAALTKQVNAHLVTHTRNRDAILAAGLKEGADADFTTIDNGRFAVPLWNASNFFRGGAGKGWTTAAAFSAISYYTFELEVWRTFEARLRAAEFNVVHRITPVSPTHQSLMARKLSRLGIPFVLGPLNGGLPWPKGFVDRQHAEREWLSHIRSGYKLLPAYKQTRRHSGAILVGSQYTQQEMPSWAQEKCVLIPENGFDVRRFNRCRTRTAGLPLKACFVGRLVPYKGADLLIEAATTFIRDGSLEVHFVGDGPEKSQLIAQCLSRNIRDRVHFHGWLEHRKVQEIMADCDFLALPSVREFGGGVVVEAMALGLSPVVADYGGPSELVDDSTGWRVAFTSSASLIDGLARTIAFLMQNLDELDRRGAVARERAQRLFSWDAKARQIISVYDAVLAGEKNLSRLSPFV